MRVIDNRILHLRTRDPDRITTVIPKSKRITTHDVLVHWGLEECKVLRNLGFKNVPSSIHRDYDWPGLYTPYSHQKEVAAFFTLNRRGFCFSDPGTGKTSSAIWAADYLMEAGAIKKALIICPLSIMDAAWRKDLFKTVMHREVAIAYSKSSDTRKEIIRSTNAEFVIINYDGIEIVRKEIIDKEFDLIIVDEANSYAKTTTRKWKTLQSIIKSNTWLWMMTGTPAAQSPLDAYGLAKLVQPDAVPKFFGAFRDQVMYKISPFKWIAKPNAKEVVFNALQPAIRYTKEECLDLPPLVYMYREAPLTTQQQKYYNQLKQHFMIAAAGENITAVNAAINVNKLLQLAGGSVYTDTGEVLEFDYSTRFDALLEILAGTPNKILLFVEYSHTIDRLKTDLKKSKYEVGVIDGRVGQTARSQICSDFQNTDKYKVLILHPKAAGHGLTLTKADTVVYWIPVSSVESYIQCNARVDRIGQANKTTVVHLYGSEIERKRYKILEDRLDFHTGVIDLYKEVIQQ